MPLRHCPLVQNRRIALLLLGLGLAACTTRQPPAPVAATAAPGPQTTSGLTAGERVWHLRAALNVAALACPSRTGGAIVDRYNRLLRDRKAPLAEAYQAEVAVFRGRHGDGWQAPFDRSMTSLYNRFAAPDGQAAFCREADAIAAEALATPDLAAFAGPALLRIEAALAAPPPVVAVANAPQVRAAAPAAAGVGWRIQLGAFTGAAAAAAAWDRIRSRQPSLAGYAPHYEPVPARPQLTRLQIGNATDRGSALTLCALAAAGGFDCIPVRR
ncbi:SPOR domain-containing protein [Sandarakinorhabdus sp. DWP1-3-1]|uniref:SPOR domain-containing protein n=1 Tax=Sandarakinorhabdus sp. DWP1-3-1 TaxID=2804627 RepID=UPI003CF28BFA